MSDNTDTGLQVLACTYISGQLDKLMKHLQGAGTAEDIEDVHQVRVACRRMRAAMRLFNDCFDEKMVAEWEKRLKKLLKSFGTARDLDVQIAFLDQTLNELSIEQKKNRPGIRRMLLRSQQQREIIQSKVIKSISEIKKKQILTNIHLQMQKHLFILKLQNPSIHSPAVYQRAYEQICRHVGELLDQCSAMNDPVNVNGHHSIRIAAKKLRYVMEICNEALKDRLKSEIKAIKKIQTLLGEIHDCDVWNSEIERFIEDERQHTIHFYGNARPFSRILAGLSFLKAERKSYRLELYEKACEYIEHLEQQAFWQKLLEMVQSHLIEKGISRENQSDGETQLSRPPLEDSDSF